MPSARVREAAATPPAVAMAQDRGLRRGLNLQERTRWCWGFLNLQERTCWRHGNHTLCCSRRVHSIRATTACLARPIESAPRWALVIRRRTALLPGAIARAIMIVHLLRKNSSLARVLDSLSAPQVAMVQGKGEGPLNLQERTRWRHGNHTLCCSRRVHSLCATSACLARPI